MPQAEAEFPKPPWYQAAMWSGSGLTGLVRNLNANRWQVSPGHWPGCCADLACAMVNSSLGAAQSLLYRQRLKQVVLPSDPVFVIGHWRTGTTLLHELLALDPRHTGPSNYHCFVPQHFVLTERWLKPCVGFALPANRPPDQMRLSWDSPQEDEFAICNLGVPSPYAMIAFPNRPPAYWDFLTLENVSPRQLEQWKQALANFFRGVLYRRPGRLVVKSPTHTFRLPVLLDMFPEARFINVVRHPTSVFLSTLRLWKSLFVAHGYQEPRFDGLEEFVLETFAQMHERLQATRGLVPEGRIIDVRYEDLVGDMLGTTQSIYDKLEVGEFDNARPLIQDYVATHQDYRPNRHQATSEVEERVYARWKPYFDCYGYSTTLPPSPPA